MPGSSGGSITLRLALAGSAEVKAALASLGPAGAKALREIEQAQVAPTAGFRALNAAGASLTSTMQGMSGRVGLVGSALSAVGPAGLVAAAGIGAAVAAAAKMADMAVKATGWAEDVTRFAKATGLSTTAVQQFDFVAASTGIPLASMREGLRGVTTVIGQLQDNLARGKASPQTRLFEAILGTGSAGETNEKLRQLGDLQKILPVILNYVAQLSPTEREGVARVLRIDPETLNSLVDARDKFADLIAMMRQYGIVADEALVKQGAEASEKLRVLRTVIGDELSVAFLRLAPAIEAGAGKLVELSGRVADLAKTIQDNWGWLSQLMQIFGVVMNPIGFLEGQAANFFAPPGVKAGRAAGAAAAQLGAGGIAGSAAGGIAGDAFPGRRPRLPALTGTGGGRGGRGGHAPKDPTDEITSHIREMLGQADNDVLNAKKAELQAQLAATKDVEVRAGIQAQLNAIEDQGKNAEIDRREATNAQWLEGVKAKKGVTEAEIKAATAAVAAAKLAEEESRLRQSGVAAQRDLNELAEKRADAEKAAEAAAKEALQAQIDLLRAQLPLTHTMQQRRDIELAIFDLEEQQREAVLRAVLANSQSTPDQKASAQGQLDSLLATLPFRKQANSDANQAGPWSAELKKLKDDTHSWTEEWQTLAADGIERFNNDLFDAQGRVQNLGQVFRSVMADMLKMLEQYLLQQAEIGIFGGGAQGGGGIVGMILGAFGIGGGGGVKDLNIPKFAGGGYVSGRGTGGSDSVFARLSSGERVMNFSASTRYGPLLDSMNAARPLRLPAFAGGGVVDPTQGVFQVHNHTNHFDLSIHAPGADPAMLQRVATAQQEQARREPERWAAYAQAAGVLPRPGRRG